MSFKAASRADQLEGGNPDGNGGYCYGTVFALVPSASPGGTWTETVLHTFVGGKGGVLFGTTSDGGASNNGTIFSLRPPTSQDSTWTYAVLHTFDGIDGASPQAALALGKNGVLYGTAEYGGSANCAFGCGTPFALKP